MAGHTPYLAIGLLALLLAASRQGWAEGSEVTVAAADCRRLVQHLPADGVVYQEGVDAHGRSVAPADLPYRSAIPLPEVFVFDVEILPLHDRRRRDQRRGLRHKLPEAATGMTLGTATVTADGRAWLNGVPLHDVEQESLAALCREALARR